MTRNKEAGPGVMIPNRPSARTSRRRPHSTTPPRVYSARGPRGGRQEPATWGLDSASFTFSGDDVDPVKVMVATRAAVEIIKALIRSPRPQPKKKRPRARGTR